MLSSDLIANFRSRVASGSVVGPFSKTCDPSMIEIIGLSGFDLVIIDLEHGPNDILNLAPLIRGAQAAGCMPIVRVIDIHQIGRALDLGAGGIQVPHVSTAEHARQVVQAARFAPAGNRGVCCYVRAAGYGSVEKQQYFSRANEAVVILQVEGKQGVENIDQIATVEGVDIIFVGVYDLSQSLGVVGQVDHPSVVEALQKVVQRCAKLGVAVGTFVESPQAVKKWREIGIRYFGYSVDVALFRSACEQTVRSIRSVE